MHIACIVRDVGGKDHVAGSAPVIADVQFRTHIAAASGQHHDPHYQDSGSEEFFE